MISRLFPLELISLTREYHVARNTTTSLVIYNLVIFSILIFMFLLPFLFVDVGIRCTGVLKAATELTVLRAASSGIVERIFIQGDQTVKKGQLLVKIRSPVLDEKELYYRIRIEETKALLNDLEQLTNIPVRVVSKWRRKWIPVTAFYKQSVSDFEQKVHEREVQFQKANRDYLRNRKLFGQGVISSAEFENVTFELDKAKGELRLLRTSQYSVWHRDFKDHSAALADLGNQLNQVCREKDILNVVAPLNGTIQGLAGIYPGSHVYMNEDIAQISPDTSLIAEVYVSPGDIGLLRAGMRVSMQVTAFNYNQWGMVQGKVSEIPDDIQTANDHTFYKVRCTLNQEFLSLTNGVKGKLKKGMAVHVSFIVAERSLWQLLYDKVDDWMNPNTI